MCDLLMAFGGTINNSIASLLTYCTVPALLDLGKLALELFGSFGPGVTN